MKRPDYRTLQALDAVIRERGFERAAQKLCITQSAVSQRIKQLENMFGQPLLVRTVPPRPTEQGAKTAGTAAPGGVAGRRVAGR
ncbi:chromosome initiation inhibitor [Escherichia coli]|nr:chromosome initiation inhibitor [Escherichia coli]